jgi:opacity protein-like surface antigen
MFIRVRRAEKKLPRATKELNMKKVVLALGLAALLAGPALAQEMDFTAVDADGDGQVTMEEAAGAGWDWTEEQFKAADADGNGVLSQEEFEAVASAE